MQESRIVVGIVWGFYWCPCYLFLVLTLFSAGTLYFFKRGRSLPVQAAGGRPGSAKSM